MNLQQELDAINHDVDQKAYISDIPAHLFDSLKKLPGWQPNNPNLVLRGNFTWGVGSSGGVVTPTGTFSFMFPVPLS